MKILYRNRKKDLVNEILFKTGKYDHVHIVGPGKSMSEILSSSLNKSSIIILINHSVSIAVEKSIEDFPKIAFTGDPCRAAEIIIDKKEKLKSCISILAMTDIFRVTKTVFNEYDYIFSSSPNFSIKYGLVSKTTDQKSIRKVSNFFYPCGYSSLPSSILLAQIFKPKYLHFWGIDFFDDKENYYSSESSGSKYYHGADLNYYGNLIKNEFLLIKQFYEKKGIKFIFNN